MTFAKLKLFQVLSLATAALGCSASGGPGDAPDLGSGATGGTLAVTGGTGGTGGTTGGTGGGLNVGGSSGSSSTCGANGSSGTLRGKVYDPAGKVPLYNVVVYVPVDPNTLPTITEGASCETCAG